MIGIYKITSPSGEIYIGKSKNIHKRYLAHRCGNSKQHLLKKSFDLHGFENHIFEIIYKCDIKDLPIFESYFINKYDSVNKGLNMANFNIIILKEEPIEISIPYYVKSIIQDKTRGAGRKKIIGGSTIHMKMTDDEYFQVKKLLKQIRKNKL